MKLVTVSSKTVLERLKDDPEFKTCYVANSNKQLYHLNVSFINAVDLCVEVEAPGGRTTPIDPSMTWDLSFRDKKGCYQAPVRRLLTRENSLVLFLESYLFFLARREKVRLPVESRSPTNIGFSYHGDDRQGFVIDFNLEGVGIQVDNDISLEVNEIIENGSFELRNRQVEFQTARIAHIAFTEEGQRVGLQFQKMDHNQEETVKQVFDAWFISQNPSLALKDEV